MIDCTSYSNTAFHQLLRGNSNYQIAIAEAETWEEVVNVLNSLGIHYTEKQIEYVKNKDFTSKL